MRVDHREPVLSDYVPFNRPFVTGRELANVEEAIAAGHASGNGPFTRRCQDQLEREIGSRRVLLTHSCTAALEMTAILAELGPGDEVVMPSFTFPSTATAFVMRGAVPVFVDVREDTLNLDERLIEAALTERTKAIVVVHYGGVAAEMDAIAAIAQRHGLLVIEDAAHGYPASYRGRPLGSLGHMAAFSFHETKNVSSGEGGALLVNDERWVERAEIVWEKGTNRAQFFRGQVDKYTWVDVGSSYLPSDIAAAILWAQLEAVGAITDRRRAIWARYHERLGDLEEQGLLRRPVVPGEREHSAHVYYVLVEPERRDPLIDALERRGVNAVFHYLPLHDSPAGRRYGRAAGELGVTRDVSNRIVRLPLWVGLDDAAVDRVADALREVAGSWSSTASGGSPKDRARA